MESCITAEIADYKLQIIRIP